MDYSLLSDFEINKLVAKATSTSVEETYQFVNGGEDIADHMSGIVLMRKISSNRKHWKLYDPCNNPADAWPIIDKYRISIINLGEDEWGARGVADCKSKRAIHENSLRAAMIVFLMIQDANHD